MDYAKSMGHCPEGYYLYVEEHATPAADKVSRKKRPVRKSLPRFF